MNAWILASSLTYIFKNREPKMNTWEVLHMGTLLPSLEVYLGKVDKTCSVVSKVQVTAIFGLGFPISKTWLVLVTIQQSEHLHFNKNKLLYKWSQSPVDWSVMSMSSGSAHYWWCWCPQLREWICLISSHCILMLLDTKTISWTVLACNAHYHLWQLSLL